MQRSPIKNNSRNSLFQVKATLILSLYSCSTFSIKTPSIRFLSLSSERYFARLDKINGNYYNDISIYLFYLFTYLLCSVGSKHGSNGGSSYIHLEHSYFFFLARSRLLLRQIISNILNIRIKMSPPRHLSNNCGHHKSK